MLATKAGVEPELMVVILSNSAARSGLISFQATSVFRREFSTNFPVKWMHKDIGLLLDSAKTTGVPLSLTSLTHSLLQDAIPHGVGDEDIWLIMMGLEEIAGVEVRGRAAR
ncbi:MAG: NAD-binding protein [Acidobacteria bacterium]|nr:NAD-binding protein [Acidobacteriota bacterium]